MTQEDFDIKNDQVMIGLDHQQRRVKMGMSSFGGITLATESIKRLALAEARHIAESIRRAAELISKPARVAEHRRGLGYEYRPNGFSGDELVKMRRKNGVGRPPCARRVTGKSLQQDMQANAMAAKQYVGRRGFRNLIQIPPARGGWSDPFGHSTAALRKSNQRKGRG